MLTAAGCSVRPPCCAANVGKHITWLNEAEPLSDGEGRRPVMSVLEEDK